MTWVAVGVGAVSLGTGAYQTYKGNKAQKALEKNRPVATIPEGFNQALNLSTQQAQQGTPEQTKRMFETEQQRAASSALQGLSSRKAGLSGIAALNQQQQDAYGSFLSEDAQRRMQNQQNLIGMLGQKADYQQQNFEINQVNPFNRASDRNQALIGSGMQNMSSGLQMGVSGVGGLGGEKTKTTPMSYPTSSSGYTMAPPPAKSFSGNGYTMPPTSPPAGFNPYAKSLQPYQITR